MTYQPLYRLDECKETMKRAGKRTYRYFDRALQAVDAAIAKSIYSATGFASWQVNAARRG